MSGRPDSSSNLGSVGGATTHTLTRAELPTGISGKIMMHWSEIGTPIQGVEGVFSAPQKLPSYRSGGDLTDGIQSIGQIDFSLGGKGTPHNNMPPYIQVTGHVRAG